MDDPGTVERVALLIDRERMREILQTRLPGLRAPGLVIDDCQIVHTRYRTSAEDARRGKAFLSVCYELAVHGGAGGERHLFHVKAYRDGRSRQKFAEASSAPTVPPPLGAAVTHLPELDLVVWAFPNDPKMLHLPEVIIREKLRRHLPYDRLAAGSDADVSIDVVRYKPEVRCITRYGLRTVALYGKTFKHDRARDIAGRIEALAGELAEAEDAFVIAPPLGFSAAARTVWQAELPGTPLPRAIERGGCQDLLARAALGLARFHALRLPDLPRTTLAGRLAAAAAEAGELAEAYPWLRARLEEVVARLGEAAPRLPPAPDGLVHGDFLLKQLVVHGDRLGVFDFDNLALGDPIQDLANFIVDLGYHGFEARHVGAMTAAFLPAYRAHAGRDVPEARLLWHVSVQRLRDAYYFHKRRQLAPGFTQEVESMLAGAEDPR